jgi:hypothetical protein
LRHDIEDAVRSFEGWNCGDHEGNTSFGPAGIGSGGKGTAIAESTSTARLRQSKTYQTIGQ